MCIRDRIGAVGGQYSRNVSGHNEPSTFLVDEFFVVKDDIIDVGCRREANTGTQRMALPNTSYCKITRLK